MNLWIFSRSSVRTSTIPSGIFRRSWSQKNSRIRYNLANQKVFWKDELCARLVLIEKDRTLNPGDLHLLRRIVLKLMPYTSVNIIQTSLVVIAREESETHRNLVDILTRAWASEKVNIGAAWCFGIFTFFLFSTARPSIPWPA